MREIMFSDFLALRGDQVLNSSSRFHYTYGTATSNQGDCDIRAWSG